MASLGGSCVVMYFFFALVSWSLTTSDGLLGRLVCSDSLCFAFVIQVAQITAKVDTQRPEAKESYITYSCRFDTRSIKV